MMRPYICQGAFVLLPSARRRAGRRHPKTEWYTFLTLY